MIYSKHKTRGQLDLIYSCVEHPWMEKFVGLIFSVDRFPKFVHREIEEKNR
jgi:hypothetical protein